MTTEEEKELKGLGIVSVEFAGRKKKILSTYARIWGHKFEATINTGEKEI